MKWRSGGGGGSYVWKLVGWNGSNIDIYTSIHIYIYISFMLVLGNNQFRIIHIIIIIYTEEIWMALSEWWFHTFTHSHLPTCTITSPLQIHRNLYRIENYLHPSIYLYLYICVLYPISSLFSVVDIQSVNKKLSTKLNRTFFLPQYFVHIISPTRSISTRLTIFFLLL